MMKGPHLIRFGNIACFSILFGYVVSTTFYTIVNFKYYVGLDYRVNFFWLGYSQTIISYALLTVFISSVLLSAISRFEKPLHVSAYLQESVSTRSLWLIGLSAVLIMIGLINGDIGYMGTYQISERRISPFGALCYIAIPPLTAIAIGYLFSLPSALKKYRKFLVVISVFLVIALMPLGRRVLMYTIILAVFLIGPTLFESFRKKRIKMFHILGFALAILVIFGWGFRTFYAMRMSISKLAFEKRPPVIEIIPYTIDLMRDSYAMTELQEKLTDNISQRPFILSYLAGLIDAHTEKNTPFFGELRHALAMAVPSLLQPQKTRKMAPAAEDVIHPLLGLPVFDGPNTMLTAGLNDLGFIGMLLYPIAMVGLYILLSRLIVVKCPPFLYLFIVQRLIYSLLYLEESLGELIGSGLRDLAIVAFCYWAILKIPAHKFAIGRFRRSDV
ncbi:hypothetical protein ACFLZE_04740 [Thermodesulfobacteriota bacterium]